MSEYELADYVSSMMGNFLSVITIYFSIITAYVVAAFASGSKLTTTQLVIVNAVFVMAAGIIGSLTVVIFNRFYIFASQLQAINNSSVLVNFTVPLAVLLITLFVSSLVFMWTVRRTNKVLETQED